MLSRQPDKVNRSQWVKALSALPIERIITTGERLGRTWTIKDKSLPQSGLGMLKLRDGALHEPFYLGEFPIATAWLVITTDDGQTVEGAAQVMDDTIELAKMLALFDAILANQLNGWEQAIEMVNEGMEIIHAIKIKRHAMLTKTHVDFSLLDSMGDGDEDV